MLSDQQQSAYLVQVLLPLFDEAHQNLPQREFRAVAAELTERFGGLTAYTRAPAEGRWQDASDQTSRDDIVVYEVMVSDLDAEWWHAFRRDLEARFRQEHVVIRALRMELL